MSVKNKLVAAGVAGAVTVGGFAIGPALAQDVTSTSQPTTSQPATSQPAQNQGNGPLAELRQGRRSAFVTDVAKQLGISVDQLKSAGKAAHQSVVKQYGTFDPTTADPAAIVQRRHEFARALADQLGVPADKVEVAGKTAFTDSVDQLVTNGRITQDEANRLVQAWETGNLRSVAHDILTSHLDSRLQTAVSNGHLTQDQANQISQHAKDGTLRGWLGPWVRQQVQSGDLRLPRRAGLIRRFLGGSN